MDDDESANDIHIIHYTHSYIPVVPPLLLSITFHYTLEYPLKSQQIQERFIPYVEAFGIPSGPICISLVYHANRVTSHQPQ